MSMLVEAVSTIAQYVSTKEGHYTLQFMRQHESAFTSELFPTLRLLTTTEGVALMDEEGTSLTSERLETLLAPTLSSPAQEGNEVHFLLYSMDETPVKGEGWRIEKDGHLTPTRIHALDYTDRPRNPKKEVLAYAGGEVNTSQEVVKYGGLSISFIRELSYRIDPGETFSIVFIVSGRTHSVTGVREENQIKVNQTDYPHAFLSLMNASYVSKKDHALLRLNIENSQKGRYQWTAYMGDFYPSSSIRAEEGWAVDMMTEEEQGILKGAVRDEGEQREQANEQSEKFKKIAPEDQGFIEQFLPFALSVPEDTEAILEFQYSDLSYKHSTMLTVLHYKDEVMVLAENPHVVEYAVKHQDDLVTVDVQQMKHSEESDELWGDHFERAGSDSDDQFVGTGPWTVTEDDDDSGHSVD